jgi:LmbE family N-acetylglucosaminyl deacetylase
MKKVYKLSAALFLFSLFLVMGVIFLRLFYIDRNVPNYAIEEWVETNEIDKVLVVFAHQDDELLVAGTIAGLDAAGIETALLTVTNGDGERRSSGQKAEDLVKERAAELQAVAGVLRMNAVEQGFSSDRGFMDVSDAAIKQLILERILHYKPSTIITWDTAKGLYGHQHHVRVGRLIVELCEENRDSPGFPVNAVYATTVSVWIREALKKLSPMFQRRYYEISSGESIEPEFSLQTKDFAEQRREAFAVYSKRRAVQNLNPLSGFPTAIEDFVFDREYFYRSY